jgi:hypothetical protein
MILWSGISCENNKSGPVQIVDTVKRINSSDTIIDPFSLPGCEILLRTKHIFVPQQNGFPRKSIGDAILNVIISKSGKLVSLELIYLKITKRGKELYMFDQSVQNDNKCPEEIKFICDRVNKELHNATIVCTKDNDKETRLRIPLRIEIK